MRVKNFAIAIMVFILGGCAIQKAPSVTKIALLAPFEGQYREIGYEALYAVRLAIAEANLDSLSLLAIDDGGRIETAILRAEAIQQDPAIQGVLLLGSYATATDVQQALGDVVTIIVGHWNTTPVGQSIVILANPDIDTQLNFSGDVSEVSNTDSSIIASETLSLSQVPQLLDNLERVEVLSSSQLPHSDFRERYLASAEFVPEPRLIAPLTYDATHILLQAIINQQALAEIDYEGVTGTFRFENGYWLDAPVNRFIYVDGELVQQP